MNLDQLHEVCALAEELDESFEEAAELLYDIKNCTEWLSQEGQ